MTSSRVRLPLALALLLGSCRKREEPAPAPQAPVTQRQEAAAPPSISTAAPGRPPSFDSLSPEFKRRILQFEADAPIKADRDAKDRQELVRPAAPGFEPEAQGKRLKLVLIPQKTMLRKGESFWYRLELQNVGTAPVRFRESDSFFKRGMYLADHWDLHVDGESTLIGPMPVPGAWGGDWYHPPGWDKLTDAQKAAEIENLGRKAREREIRHGLEVDLQPGETIVSRAWRHLTDQECDAILAGGGDCRDARFPGPFRELYSDRGLFEKPSTYRVKFVFSDPPPEPPTERDIRRNMKHYGSSRELELRAYRQSADNAIGVLESNSSCSESRSHLRRGGQRGAPRRL